MSNSFCEGNGRHGHIANRQHLLDLYRIESPHKGGLPHQGADKGYVTVLLEATYVFPNGLFALLMCLWLSVRRR